MLEYPFMKSIIKSSFIFLAIILSTKAFGKTLTDTTKKDTDQEKATIKIGADYMSNDVFMGRTAKTAVPVFSPNIKYTFGAGIYIGGTADLLPNNKKNKLDGGDLDLGYEFDITDNLSGDLSYTKMFYNANSNQIGSAVSSVLNANFDYDISDIVTPSVSMDYNFNKQGISNDLFLNFGLSHDVTLKKIFGEHDRIVITPTVGLNAGSQNFYDAYLQKKIFKNGKHTTAQNQLVDQFETGAGQFKLLDYELSVPMAYKAGPFRFLFTPEYDIVENGFKPTTTAKSLGVPDNSAVFYVTVGVALKF